MDIMNTFGPTYTELAALGRLWNTFVSWFANDEGAMANSQSNYEAAHRPPAPESAVAPLPIVARNFGRECSTSYIPPESIELRYWPIWDEPPWACSYAVDLESKPATAVAGLRVEKKAECKPAQIPYEAIEYRYGGTEARNHMHLPICMNK